MQDPEGVLAWIAIVPAGRAGAIDDALAGLERAQRR
jgi:hypothetical protein